MKENLTREDFKDLDYIFLNKLRSKVLNRNFKFKWGQINIPLNEDGFVFIPCPLLNIEDLKTVISDTNSFEISEKNNLYLVYSKEIDKTFSNTELINALFDLLKEIIK